MSCDHPKKFYYNHPHLGLYPFEIYACSQKEAIEQYKKEHKLKRLPNGFQLWEAPKQVDLGDTNIND